MAYSADIRAHIKLMEATYERPYDGSPNVGYDEVADNKGDVTKVVANLSSFQSGKYTRLAQNIKRMQDVARETLELESQIKQDAREAIADLFAAEDAAYTRVVETVSFTLQITKDPKAATTVQYAKVLDELQTHLTPELVKVLESIKAKFSKVNAPKPAALSHSPKDGGVGYGESVEQVTEAPLFDKMKAFFQKYLQKIQSWGASYDSKLAKLKASVGVTEHRNPVMESVSPDSVALRVWQAVSKAKTGLTLSDRGPIGASFTVHADDTVYEVSVRHVT